ncbi:amino acid ABC transporter substrate-binding protein [uncultured Rhodospira sp.]|uniref:amino acid ABC transporter substrate-binding protein n=1 Tax=uncultured Rhodospira sp. TaxID=1936189 RepID=UPI002616182D|nr:amino acid ABC transporter substrate-binding protein [uncultured Rhodospira sp.]
MTRFVSALVAGLATLAVGAAGAQAAETLDTVKERGELSCGVTTGLAGFSIPDQSGAWSGLDADFCRAVAAAVLGDASKVRFVPLTAKERFTALQSGEIDVLSRVTTWTFTRDTSLGLNFVGTTFYDGQGFMVNKDLGVSSATELDGASICVGAGTTTELNLADYFRIQGMDYNPVVFAAISETAQGFESGRCDVLTSDQSQLYAIRSKLEDPSSAVVLPEVISKEPLGPVVRQGDDEWFNIVKWVLFAQLNAEELGVTSDNIEEMKGSDNPSIKRLVGTEGDMGEKLGLSADWAAQIIAQVGNYGEMFERNVGEDSPLEIARGLNALWTDGGIQYAPPIR